MVKSIILERVGNCELVAGEHLMYDIPMIVNSLETTKYKHKVLTSEIIHSHDSVKSFKQA
jgi:hypothetical protein